MSRLAVAVSVTVALSLAIFLTILVLLLADLFCAHLRRRRLLAEASQSKLGALTSLSPARTDDDGSVATTATTTAALSSTPPFYYAHGVLHAPNTKDLLLAIPKLESAVWRWSPARRSSPSRSGSSTGSSARGDGFMCISNPVYDRGGGGAQGQAAPAGGDSPPFQTPGGASPLGITEEEDGEEGGFSPPLAAMRKLPPVGVVAYPPPALSFADARPALTVTDANRASSSSSNINAHFFYPWSSK
ncbi:unnamed protein product [Urochloa humidicola]